MRFFWLVISLVAMTFMTSIVLRAQDYPPDMSRGKAV